MTEKFYDFFASEKEEFHLKHQLHYYQNILRYLYARKYIGNNDVLEVGCGSGFQIPPLISVFKTYTGLDLSKNSLKLFKHKYLLNKDKINLIYGTGLKLPFKSERFDVILCMDVIEHVPKEKRAVLLDNIKQSLKPSGKLIISAPNFLSSFGLVRKIIELFIDWQSFSDMNPDIDDWFTPEKLKSLLKENGFIVHDQVGSFYFPPYFSGKRYFLPNVKLLVQICTYLEKILSRNPIFKNFGYTIICICEKANID